jgi:hypothetical protein
VLPSHCDQLIPELAPLIPKLGANLPSSLAEIHSLRLGLLSLWYLCQYSVRTGFRYRHWAGLNNHTHAFALAVVCVFVKSRSSLVTATSPLLGWHPLSRSYGASLPSSLAVIHSLRLGLLSL